MKLEAKHILNSPNVVCPKCGCQTFKEVFILKRVSAILSPTGKEELYPIPLFACSSCGEIPDEYKKKPNAKAIFGEATATEEEQKPSGLIV